MIWIKFLLLITIALDITIAVWVTGHKNINLTERNWYTFVFGIAILWEIAMWASFFVHVSQQVDFFIDASSFAFGAISAFALLLYASHLAGFTLAQKRIALLFALITVALSIASFIPNVFIGYRNYIGSLAYEQYIDFSPYINIFYVGIFLELVVVLFLLFWNYRRQTGLTKQQLLVILAGLSATIIVVILTNILPQFFLKIYFNEFSLRATQLYIAQQLIGVMSISLFSLSTAYAITRLRFMNAKVVFQKTTIYAAIMLLSVVLCLVLIQLIIATLPLPMLWIALFCVLAVIFAHKYVAGVRRILDRYCFKDQLDAWRQISADSKKVNSTIQLQTWAAATVATIQSSLNVPVESVYVQQREHNRLAQYFPFHKRGGFSYSDNFLSILNDSSKSILTTVDFEHTQQKNSTYKNLFQKKKISAALVLRQNDHIIGLIFLGTSQQYKTYNHKQLQFLQQVIDAAETELPELIHWYETLEGIRRKLHEDAYKVVL